MHFRLLTLTQTFVTFLCVSKELCRFRSLSMQSSSVCTDTNPLCRCRCRVRGLVGAIPFTSCGVNLLEDSYQWHVMFAFSLQVCQMSQHLLHTLLCPTPDRPCYLQLRRGKHICPELSHSPEMCRGKQNRLRVPFMLPQLSWSRGFKRNGWTILNLLAAC